MIANVSSLNIQHVTYQNPTAMITMIDYFVAAAWLIYVFALQWRQ